MVYIIKMGCSQSQLQPGNDGSSLAANVPNPQGNNDEDLQRKELSQTANSRCDDNLQTGEVMTQVRKIRAHDKTETTLKNKRLIFVFFANIHYTTLDPTHSEYSSFSDYGHVSRLSTDCLQTML